MLLWILRCSQLWFDHELMGPGKWVNILLGYFAQFYDSMQLWMATLNPRILDETLPGYVALKVAFMPHAAVIFQITKSLQKHMVAIS